MWENLFLFSSRRMKVTFNFNQSIFYHFLIHLPSITTKYAFINKLPSESLMEEKVITCLLHTELIELQADRSVMNMFITEWTDETAEYSH